MRIPMQSYLIGRWASWALLLASASAARAQQVSPPSSSPSPALRGRIIGVLFDSVAMQPITGATVQLAPGTDSVPQPNAPGSRLTTSLRGGRFTFDSVGAGGWTLVVRNARFDSLGIAQLATAVHVKTKGTTRVRLAVPSVRGLVASVQWLEYLIDRRGAFRRMATVEVAAGTSGAFVACGVPLGGAVRLAAWSGADSTGDLDFVMPASGITPRELFVGASRATQVTLPRDSSSTTDSLVPTTRTVRRGSAQLAGRIMGPGGQPLANARVTVHEAGLEVTSNADGGFVLVDLPAGTRTLDVRAIGFEPWQSAVDLFADETTTGSWEMTRTVMLDTVQVRTWRAQLLGRDMVGFEERRRSGMGRFLDPDQLTRMDPLRFTQIFFTMPGVRVETGFGGDVLLMRGSGLQPLCAPQLWLNGMRMPNDGSLDGFIMGTEVRAVEVYTASFVPFQYGNSMSGCGAILVWTGPRQIPSATGTIKE